MELWLSALIFIIGLVILIKGSDFFVGGAAFVARYFGVSGLIIGLTLVSLGTSLPELGASVYASATGKSSISVGNVVGSNIANISLVLGVCLLLRSITVKKRMLKRDGIIMVGISLLFALFVFGGVERWEGLVLMVIFVSYMILLYTQNKKDVKDEAVSKARQEAEEKEKEGREKGLGKEVALLTLGCIGVVIGSKLLVDSAVDIASNIGISHAVIGSTLVAFGTSVPELAVSLTAIIKKYEEISIGNIIGSNIFNILWVIGVAALVSPLTLDLTSGDSLLLTTNIPIMLIVAFLLLIFMATGRKLVRWEGGVFVAIYAVFLAMNFW
jgi:cation:H+ antiporter